MATRSLLTIYEEVFSDCSYVLARIEVRFRCLVAKYCDEMRQGRRCRERVGKLALFGRMHSM